MIQTQQLIPQSPSEITSPSPFSPFSTASLPDSELATSDEAPDLGDFENILREFNDLRLPTVVVPRTGLDATPSSSIFALPSGSESERSNIVFAPRTWAAAAPAHSHSQHHGADSTVHHRVRPSAAAALQQHQQPPPRTAGNTPSSPLIVLPSAPPSASDDSDHSARHRATWGPSVSRPRQQHRLITDLIPSASPASSYYSPPSILSGSDSDIPLGSAADMGPLTARPPPRATDAPPVSLEAILGSSIAVPFSRSQVDLASLVEPTTETETGTEDMAVFTEDEDDEGIIRPPASSSPSESTSASPVFSMDDVDLGDVPNLGALDEAFKFIAAERERMAAARAAASASTSTRRLGAEAKRKRRRKRSAATTDTAPTAAEGDESSSSPDAASSLDAKSAAAAAAFLRATAAAAAGPPAPATPPRNRRERRRLLQLQRSPGTDSSEAPAPARLAHSKSTPSLRAPPALARVSAVDPRVLQLRALANKLRLMFPDDARYLSKLFTRESPDVAFVDPRGRSPTPNDNLVHVFIDHSNILFGFLNYIKRRMRPIPKQKHISYSALALILERGRPVSRRVLATSSPLYQPTDGAEAIGYEVHVYARVPDTGDGADRVRRPGHTPKNSYSGSNSGANDSGSGSGDPKAAPGGARGASPARPRHHKHSKSYSGPVSQSLPSSSALPTLKSHTPVTAGSSSSGAGARVKYREQGVDELLQLKLHQAIAAADEPVPPGSTIVLATGDGNVGQFNEEGFLGCVRTALKKGWRVELYAWEDGLSRAWRREFKEQHGAGRFTIVGLEQFAAELLETHPHSQS